MDVKSEMLQEALTIGAVREIILHYTQKIGNNASSA